MEAKFLQASCRKDWSLIVCDLGNILAVLADIIGFTCILPQIYQVWSYQSVAALHVLWPTILFTAKFINTFYIFSIEDRTFFRVSNVYYPLVYFVFLLEFWMFSSKSVQKKLSFVAVCLIIWASFLVIELAVSDGARKLIIVCVILYSIKLVPQLILNIQLRTTFGQSTITVLLFCIHSTLSYVSALILDENLEYHIMHYLSASLSYINAMQVIWYPHPSFKKPTMEVTVQQYGTMVDTTDYSIPFEERNLNIHSDIVPFVEDENILIPDAIEQNRIDVNFPKNSLSKETSYASSFGPSQTINFPRYFQKLKEKTGCEIMLLLFLFMGVITFALGLGFITKTFLTLAGPLTMFIMFFLSSIYRDYKQGLFSYYIANVYYKIYGV